MQKYRNDQLEPQLYFCHILKTLSRPEMKVENIILIFLVLTQ